MTRVGIDRAGYPFIVASVLLAAAAWAVVGWWLALPIAILAAFFLFFFRDPERVVASASNAVLSPADGRVLVAGPAVASAAPAGEWLQISIFLSPMDVHVNRIPVSGRVTRVNFTPGKYLPAYRPDAATSNERSEIWIENAPAAVSTHRGSPRCPSWRAPGRLRRADAPARAGWVYRRRSSSRHCIATNGYRRRLIPPGARSRGGATP